MVNDDLAQVPTDLRALPPLQVLSLRSVERSDLGNARRLVGTHGEDLHHVPEHGRWLVWDGCRWKTDLTGEVMRRAKAVTDDLRNDAHATGDDRAYSFAVRSQSVARVRAMVELASTEPGVPLVVDELDADPFLFTVANGTLNLRTGQLQPHRRANLTTKMSEVKWDPEAVCPRVDRFLAQILPDPEVRDFVLRAVGYSLTGEVSEQIIFIEYGTGSNGKSTLKELLLKVLGDHAMPAAPKMLLAKTHDGHPTAIADLQGRRLVVAHEVEDGLRLDETLVKELTGGDRLKARYMRQDFFEFPPTHKLWLACNHKPQIRGTDHGIWRRIRLIPFDVTISDEDKDPHLLSKLSEELPGLLRRAVEGCLAWQRDGLIAPRAVTEATERYRIESDLVSQFLDEHCVGEVCAQVRSTVFFAAYQNWCAENGIAHPLSQKALAKRLTEKGYDRGENRQGQALWRGLRILNPEDRTDKDTL